MPINVKQAIDSSTGERIKIYRKTPGEYIDGEWVEGRTKTIKAMASEQPLKPEMIALANGLERTKDVKAFFVNKFIQASDEFNNQTADEIEWKSQRYRTMKLGDWDSYGYSLVMGVRIS